MAVPGGCVRVGEQLGAKRTESMEGSGLDR
jgi:hypothetical protein